MLKGKNKTKFNSRSNKKDISIELISNSDCGVDIDLLNLNLPNSFRKYLNKYEKELIQKNKVYFSYIWTAREAIFKCLKNPQKTDFFVKIKIFDIDITKKKGMGLFSDEKFELNFFVLKNQYLICLARKY